MEDLSTSFPINLSIVIPCLNEEETIAVCVEKCIKAFSDLKINGEIIVVDNNSKDASAEIAIKSGARVINNQVKGYGATLREGFKNAKGEYILFADGDNSYDFNEITKFWQNKDNGNLIIGSRFKGTIHKGAMPKLHRYFGTPLLTFIINFLYKINISDSQTGMRMFRKDILEKINLECDGMEFASELFIKISKKNMKIYEIPISLHKDGRTNHKPHLRPFRDGFRHLFYMIKEKFTK